MRKNKIIHAKQVNLKKVKSVLVITPFNIEDFILSAPAIDALKDAMPPGGKITAVTSAGVARMAEGSGAIDRVIVCKTLNPFTFMGTAGAVLFSGYDVLVNFNPGFKTSFIMSFLSGAPARVAYAFKKDAAVYNAMHNLKLHTIGSPQHKIVKYLNLVRFIGANSYDFTPKLKLSDEAKKYAADFIKKHSISDEDVLIGLHPVLPDESKRWSIKKFEQLTVNLVQKYGAKAVVFYHSNEKKRLNEFMHVIRNKAIPVDTTDYMKQAAVSMYLSCFICNETDFMHIFSPFTHVVVIWGESDPEENRPGGPQHEVMKAGDGKADSVPVSRVTDYIKKYLKK